jgi:hypothetical protein
MGALLSFSRITHVFPSEFTANYSFVQLGKIGISCRPDIEQPTTQGSEWLAIGSLIRTTGDDTEIYYS